MDEKKGFIKVNLPIDKEGFVIGGGEGIWVAISSEIEKLYNNDYFGGEFKGLLQNDSFYYPSLTHGSEIVFTMRGKNRPVALYDGQLSMIEAISEDERRELMRKIQENQKTRD